MSRDQVLRPTPLRWIGRLYRRTRLAPATLGTLIGMLLAAAILLAGARLLIGAEFAARDAAHADESRLLDAITSEAHALISRLDASRLWDCSPGSQQQIRRELFGARYFREVGTFNTDGLLACTSTDEDIGAPFAVPPPAGVSASGLTYSVDVPLILSEHETQRLTATIIARGRFNLVFDPLVEATLRDSAVGMAALRAGKGLIPVYTRTSLPPPDGDAIQAGHVNRWWRGEFSTLDDAGLGDFVLYSRWSWSDVLRNQSGTAVAVLLIAVLAGLLTRAGLPPWLARLDSIDQRVSDLLESDGILCLYQPIVALDSGRTIGCEVLMRFRDDNRLIYPDEAIPSVLRQGLGWEMDRRVSRRALAELERHLQPRGPFRVALNFFADSLDADRVAATLGEQAARLREQDVRIEIEFTEYTFAEDAITQTRRLAAAGFGISIDDFGTGYSNLASVMQMSPDYLKIHRSFVHEMEASAIRASLIPEIIQIAHVVNAQVVAEGIENEAQLNRLRALGVDFGQGYFFARPMPIADFVAWLGDEACAIASRPSAAA